MHLTRHTDYGLRILIYLALLEEDRLASIDEISDKYGVSRNTVNKIVHQLGTEEVIETRRGKGGGFRLKAKPSAINIGDIVELLESNLTVVDCEANQCRIAPVCRLQGVLKQATDSFLQTLRSFTLEDILHQRQDELVSALDIVVQR